MCGAGGVVRGCGCDMGVCILWRERKRRGKKGGGRKKKNSRMCFSRSKTGEEARWVEKVRQRLRKC